MNKRRLVSYLTVAIAVLLVVSFFLPKETHPSPDTRVILEHSYHTYIAPDQQLGCFEQSDPTPTNFLDEATLEDAWDLNYEPHDSCTEEALESESEPLMISLLKDVGILSKQWDEW